MSEWCKNLPKTSLSTDESIDFVDTTDKQAKNASRKTDTILLSSKVSRKIKWTVLKYDKKPEEWGKCFSCWQIDLVHHE